MTKEDVILEINKENTIAKEFARTVSFRMLKSTLGNGTTVTFKVPINLGNFKLMEDVKAGLLIEYIDEIILPMKQQILNTITDLCSDFLYYDRKEDEDLSMAQLNQAVVNGEITVDEMVAEFRKNLEETFSDVNLGKLISESKTTFVLDSTNYSLTTQNINVLKLPLNFEYCPLPDITTFELALCVSVIEQLRFGGIMPNNPYLDQPHFRHFKITNPNKP